MTPGLQRSFGLAAAAVVLAAVAIALLRLGSPTEERMSRLDARRVSDLQALARSLNVFWTRHARLPDSLQDLVGEPGLGTAITDPQTREPYEYRRLDPRYEVCAQFTGADRANDERSGPPGFWAHGAGRTCFMLTPVRAMP
jgi:hypothetical protein